MLFLVVFKLVFLFELFFYVVYVVSIDCEFFFTEEELWMKDKSSIFSDVFTFVLCWKWKKKHDKQWSVRIEIYTVLDSSVFRIKANLKRKVQPVSLLNGHFKEREKDPSCELSSVFLSVVVGFMAVIQCQILKILWIKKDMLQNGY